MTSTMTVLHRFRGALAMLAIAAAATVTAAALESRQAAPAAEARRLAGAVDALYRRAGDLEAAMEAVARNEAAYRALVAAGFDGPPDRDLLARLLADATADRIDHMRYRIEPPAADGRSGTRTVPVTLELAAATDRDVVELLDHLVETVPGVLRLRRLALERVEVAVDAGSRVHGSVSLDWVRASPPADSPTGGRP